MGAAGLINPNQRAKKWDTAWRKHREKAKLPGLRFHDLRHTIITEFGKMSVPDHAMESISGHLFRRMLEHYFHIRLDAKRRDLGELGARHATKSRAASKNNKSAGSDRVASKSI